MRLIGHLPAAPEAKRFVDYLVSRRVAAHAEEAASGAWQIWVEHDDELEAAAAELERFRLAPEDGRFDAAGQAAKVRREETKAAVRRQRNFRDVRTTLFVAPHGPTPVTLVVIGLCVAIFVAFHAGGAPAQEKLYDALFFDDPNNHRFGMPGPRSAMFASVLRGQVWRLVSPAFFHTAFLHLLFNLMWMLDLGRRIEPVKGSAKMLGLVLATAALSCTAEAAWAAVSPFNPEHYQPFLGLSGVVAGLFGYAWVCGRLRPYERVGVSDHETGYMLGWLIICTLGVVGPVANAAHWGGLLIGAGLGALPSVWKRR